MNKYEVAVFGAGCFWCVEAVFQIINGVSTVESGYMGGAKVDPSYEDICTGNTGHVEVIRITFDPALISFADLLMVLFEVHDPTTLNQQGQDKGSQYRSVIFYMSERQKELGLKAVEAAAASGVWPNPIVTAIEPAATFYKAEENHQDYYSQNSEASYCSYVIRPKVDKFKLRFKDLLK